MKQNLLKLALCAMTFLPLGAWADIDFGTQATVSTTKTWDFEDLKVSSTYNSVTNQLTKSDESTLTTDYYLRAATSPNRFFTVNKLAEETSLTYADGTVVSVNNYITSNAETKSSPATTDLAGTTTTTGVSSFAFNASVAGTVYVKIKGTANDNLQIYFYNGTNITIHRFTATGNIDEIAYTSTEQGVFYVGDITSSYSIYSVRFVPTSETRAAANAIKNYDFNKSLIGVASVIFAGDGLYLRGYGAAGSTTTVSGGRSVIVASKTGDDPTSVTLGGESVTVSKIVTTDSAVEAPTSDTKDASSTSGNKGTPMLAVKTSVPGTLYVAMTPKASGSGGTRLYFSNGTENPSESSSERVTLTSAGTVYYPSKSSATAGTFFVGATVAVKIFAMRFVPETVTAPTIKNNNGTITITAGVSSISSAVTTYYTTDGSDPTSSGTRSEYTAPFSQTTTATIRAASISSGSTASDIAEKTVPTIPTALSSSSTTLDFAGLETSAVTVDDEDNFTIDSSAKSYTTKSASASALYINNVSLCYSTASRIITLHSDYLKCSGSALTITIPGLTAGNIVMLSASSDNSSAATFTCTSGGTILSGATTSIQTTPTNLIVKSTGGNMVLTTASAGLRLYSITVTDGIVLNETDGVSPYSDISDKEVKISFTRTFTTGKASTVCLPFSMTAPSASVGTFATFTSVNAEMTEVTYSSVSEGDALTAGTPYIFIPATSEVTFSNNAYTIPNDGFTAATAVDNGSWHFKGTYEKLTWTDGQTVLYGLASSDFVPTSGSATIGDFVRFNSGATPAFRAYMYYGASDPKGAPAYSGRRKTKTLPDSMKVILVGQNGETTNIGTISVVSESNDWFTIDGRKLNGKPDAKGLYINGGRKVIVK